MKKRAAYSALCALLGLSLSGAALLLTGCSGHVADSAQARYGTPAPLADDAIIRVKTIAFEEERMRADPGDPVTASMLSGQYVQRYREQGDVADILRAQHMAEVSLRAHPANNVTAYTALANAQLAQHHFRDARITVRKARRIDPEDEGLLAFEAALDMEIGDMTSARKLLDKIPRGSATGAAVRARYAELTGDIETATRLLHDETARIDASFGIANERRAWLHARLGELYFNCGRTQDAATEERTALARFPADALALTDLARFTAADGDWHASRTYAQKAVTAIPSPENLGLLSDAQAKLGDLRASLATRDAIYAIEKIGNSIGLFDRAIALYDADHQLHAADSIAVAQKELSLHDDVFVEDAIAWTAARGEHWRLAKASAARAIAWNTADPRIWFHAGYIADRTGDAAHARTYYAHALRLNPKFAPQFADESRLRLSKL